MDQPVNDRQESLASLLGGRGGAVDATLPPVAFGLAWWIFAHSVAIGVAAAIITSAILTAIRIRQGRKPRSVLIGLTGVCIAGAIAIYTGRAEDFFAIQVFSNIASMLAWTISIVVRWPLLGVIVGGVLGQRTRWRRDRELVRGYGRASWAWVAQYAIRVVTYLPLWLLGATEALTVARVALSWPLVAACLAVSWWILMRVVPADHPGIRHPRASVDVR